MRTPPPPLVDRRGLVGSLQHQRPDGPHTIVTPPDMPATSPSSSTASQTDFAVTSATHPSSSSMTPPSSSSTPRHQRLRTTYCIHLTGPRQRSQGRASGPAPTRRLPHTLGCVAVPVTRLPAKPMFVWATSVGPTPLTKPITVEDIARNSLDMGT